MKISFLKSILFFLIFALVIFTHPRLQAADSSETFKKFMKLKQSSKIGDAIDFLSEKIKTEAEPEKKSLENFLLGYTQYQQFKDKEALAAFTEVIQSKSKLEDYATYFLGLTQKRSNDLAGAKNSFRKVLSSQAPDSIVLESKYNLGLIAIDEKKFKDADLQFRMILKKWKSSEKYPEVLWQIMRVQKSLHQNFCKNAREIYSRYPTYVGAKFWGHSLSRDLFEGVPTRCQPTAKEEQSRIKFLQLGGDIDRALEELKGLRVEMAKSLVPKNSKKVVVSPAANDQEDEADSATGSITDSTTSETPAAATDDEDEEVLTGLYSIDSMIANVLIAQGKADEAFKLLLGYYDQQSYRSGYLKLLAKAAGRLGEYQAAASAFDKIYHLSPRSKNGKDALFQAAFLSYQFQDYDGASRKFEEFVRNFSNTALTRDSQWHIAWLKYLKGDYEGSYVGFQKISLMKATRYKTVRVGKRRRRQRRKVEIPTDTVTVDRAKYWMAMSLFRLDKFDQARTLFEALSRDSGIGYYSVASFYRLQNFPAKAKVVIAPAAQDLGAGTAPGATPNPEAEASVGEDMRAQETTTLETANGQEDVTDGASDAIYSETNDSEKVLSGNFRDPVLAKRFERAQLLSQIGLNDLSRLELSEIEKHIRSMQDRKQLMEQYQTVQSYFRSSSLGEIAFSGERIRGGITSSRGLWEYAYPRAYDNFVVPNAKSLGVSESLVWGIMRSESHYRSEARSPVGALGLMQLMPFTSKKVADLLGLKEFQVDKLIEPETNIKLGTRYLKRLNEKYRYVPLVAAAYNAGPHRVASWLKSFGLLDMDEFIEHIPYVETRNYVKRVVRNYQIYALLYNAKNSSAGHTLKWLAKPIDVRLPEGPLGLEVW
jgi:soluble lytic murein transglycosylase